MKKIKFALYVSAMSLLLLISCKGNNEKSSKTSHADLTMRTIHDIYFMSISEKVDTIRSLGFESLLTAQGVCQMFLRSNNTIEAFVLYQNGNLEYQTENLEKLRQLVKEGVDAGLYDLVEPKQDSPTKKAGVVPQKSDDKPTITTVKNTVFAETFNSADNEKPYDFKNISIFTGRYDIGTKDGIPIYFLEIAHRVMTDTLKTQKK